MMQKKSANRGAVIDQAGQVIRPNDVELLAPAKNMECGLAAIEHGADAVYIGGPAFSARAAAGNTLSDIKELIDTARQFYVRVYVALNTILKDPELNEAVDMIHRLYEIKADAVIIQDMGLLECRLPPIALHASTQVNIRSKEKVQFLEQLGFQQVVLARELSIPQIADIAANTGVTLECFVHGALCVSYSGQCYISEVMTGRSANRGECAQFCRHSFTLKDASGELLEKNKHLLSLKDLNQVNNLESLLDAGVRSFKIEGRLKDSGYVKNITALYRQRLDLILETRNELRKSSSGKTRISFQPDAVRTFNRGQSEYFLHGKKRPVGSIDTPKSIGEKIGRVVKVGQKYIEIETSGQLHNGDGLCYFNADKEMVGFRLNRVEGVRLFPAKMVRPPSGSVLYRNFDKKFQQQLNNSSSCRKVSVWLRVFEDGKALVLMLKDEDGVESMWRRELEKQTARKPEMTREAIAKQVARSGDTIFVVEDVDVEVDPSSFYPPAEIKEMRREAFVHHLKKRVSAYKVEDYAIKESNAVWPGGKISYLDNVMNSRAEAFYKRHGAQFSGDSEPKDLMTCKYCIREQLNLCMKKNGNSASPHHGPLYLSDNVGEYKLIFDCKQCEMILRKNPDPEK